MLTIKQVDEKNCFPNLSAVLKLLSFMLPFIIL